MFCTNSAVFTPVWKKKLFIVELFRILFRGMFYNQKMKQQVLWEE